MADLAAPPRPLVVPTAEDTCDDLAEAMANLCRYAKRQQCIVGTLERPTPWDDAHRGLDAPLDAWLAKAHAPA